jgi:hypothetical protein
MIIDVTDAVVARRQRVSPFEDFIDRRWARRE